MAKIQTLPPVLEDVASDIAFNLTAAHTYYAGKELWALASRAASQASRCFSAAGKPVEAHLWRQIAEDNNEASRRAREARLAARAASTEEQAQ